MATPSGPEDLSPSISNDEQPHTLTLTSISQGYLQKQSKTVKQFRKRWIVLTQTHLQSFRNETAINKKPTESFDLIIYNKIKIIDKTQFCLLSDKNPSRAFIADSSEALMQWITSIGHVQSELTQNNTEQSRQALNDKDIKQQLQKFGYTDKEIQSAFERASGKHYDINDIHEYIKALQIVHGHTDTMGKFENTNDWNELLQGMDSLDETKQLRILRKLKKIADKMLKNSYQKYERIYLDKSKLKYTILIFEGGLQFLYNLGFEEYSDNRLVCREINPIIIKHCTECLDDRMKSLKLCKQTKNVNTTLLLTNNSNSDLLHASMSSLHSFDPFCTVMQPGMNGTADDDGYQYLWDEYVSVYGKPKRAEQFILWCKKQGVSIKFTDAKTLIKSNGHIAYDMQKTHRHSHKEEKESKVQKKSAHLGNGQTKQFLNFLRENRLDKYFGQFKERNCCAIKDIEYLHDDTDFLMDEIGMTFVIERKRFIGECKKLSQRMKEFERVKMSEMLRQKLDRFGIVTRDILCKEVRSKMELRSKFGLNDEQCNLLWNVIERKVEIESVEKKEKSMDLNEGIEGVQNNVIDANVIDTMHGYMLNDKQIVNKANEMNTPYI